MANIVEEFCLKFKTEGSKVVVQSFEKVIASAKKMQDMDKKGIVQTEKQTKAITKQSSALWLLAKRLLGVYSVYALFRKGLNLAVNFAETGTAISNMATVAGVSAKQLQKWDYVYKKYGGKGSMGGTLASLQAKLDDFNYYGKGFEEFQKHGGFTPAGMDVETFLKALADKVQSVPDYQARDLLREAGINDPALASLLLRGNIDKELAGAKVAYSNSDLKKAQEAKAIFNEFQTQITKLENLLAVKFLPNLIDFIEELIKFTEDPIGYVKGKTQEKAQDIINSAKTSITGKGGDPNEFFVKRILPLMPASQSVYRVMHDFLGEGGIMDRIDGWAWIGEQIKKGVFNGLDYITDIPAVATVGQALANSSILNNTFDQVNNFVINGAQSPVETATEVAQRLKAKSQGYLDTHLNTIGLQTESN